VAGHWEVTSRMVLGKLEGQEPRSTGRITDHLSGGHISASPFEPPCNNSRIVGNPYLIGKVRVARDPGVSGIDSHKPTYQY
jgi:hypothetical protein